mmetsp:Transcript_27303/g.63843  ORF Transcript_27303/g.63843 Transcript_27303/m.63843 type:complete len:200 (-) Transcript_27303:324-923(-)
MFAELKPYHEARVMFRRVAGRVIGSKHIHTGRLLRPRHAGETVRSFMQEVDEDQLTGRFGISVTNATTTSLHQRVTIIHRRHLHAAPPALVQDITMIPKRRPNPVVVAPNTSGGRVSRKALSPQSTNDLFQVAEAALWAECLHDQRVELVVGVGCSAGRGGHGTPTVASDARTRVRSGGITSHVDRMIEHGRRPIRGRA